MGVSLNGDGTLKAAAVDACEHSIAHHSDGEKDGVEYVRMTADERSKLSLVGSGANLLTLQVNSRPALTDGNVELRDSSTIIFDLQAPNVVRAHLNIPSGQSPVHHYGIVPSHVNPGSADWKNFKTSSLGTAYVEGSLRIYINGMRVFSGVRVPVFPSSGSTPTQWKLFSVSSESASDGTFELNDSIPDPETNKIVIDFDVIPAGASSSSSSSSSASSSSSSSS